MARASLSFIGVLLVAVTVFLDEALRVIAANVDWMAEKAGMAADGPAERGFDTWLEAMPFVQLFALLGLIRAVAPLIPQLLNAVGQARRNFVYSAACAVVLPTSFVVGAQFGIEGVVVAWLIAYPLVVMILFHFGARVLGMPLHRFTVRAMAGLLTVVPTGLLALGMQWILSDVGLSPDVARLSIALPGTLTAGWTLAYLLNREAFAVLRRRGSKS